MFKIVLVDDKENNNTSLELLIELYMEKNKLNFNHLQIILFDNGMDCIKHVLKAQNVNLIFLDLMMPKIHGMDVLEVIRLSNISNQPKVIIATALHDKSVRNEAKSKLADAFITKPINYQMVESMLDTYMKPKLQNQFDLSKEIQKDPSDEMFLDFHDFDDNAIEVTQHQKNKIETLNKTHTHVHAKEFIKDVDNLQFLLDDFYEIESDLIVLIDNLNGDTIKENIKFISESLNTYASILISFVDFYELSMTLRTLDNLICEADFGERMLQKDKNIIARFISAMLNDLVDWLNHVFILQDSVDVFYINASVLSSCVQLENLIKKAYEIS